MDRRWLLILALLAGSASAAPVGPVYVDSGTPSGACAGSRNRITAADGLDYCCVSSTWTLCNAVASKPMIAGVSGIPWISSTSIAPGLSIAGPGGVPGMDYVGGCNPPSSGFTNGVYATWGYITSASSAGSTATNTPAFGGSYPTKVPLCVYQSAAAETGAFNLQEPTARGSATNGGGFVFVGMWTSASSILSVGLSPLGTVTATPTTRVNFMAYTCQGHTNLQFCTNDGSGTASCTDLGATFPCIGGPYNGIIWALPNDSVVYYALQKVTGTRDIVTGSVSTDLPAGNLATYPHVKGWSNALTVFNMCIFHHY